MIRIEYSCYIILYSINLDVCSKLENARKRYGRLYKFEIHIHTSASSYQIHKIINNSKKPL